VPQLAPTEPVAGTAQVQPPPPPEPGAVPLPTAAEEVEVTDPTHPLYGRCFRVLALLQPRHGTRLVVVAGHDSQQLRLPLAATNLSPRLPLPATKFTLDALRDFLSLVKECTPPCPSHPPPSGRSSPRPCNNSSVTTWS